MYLTFSAKHSSVTFHQLLNQLRLFSLADKVLQWLAPRSLKDSSPAILGLDSRSFHLCVISRLTVLWLPPTVPPPQLPPPTSSGTHFLLLFIQNSVWAAPPPGRCPCLAPSTPPTLGGLLQYCVNHPSGLPFPLDCESLGDRGWF